jgi:DNA-binding GntR family transcriptional regulator
MQRHQRNNGTRPATFAEHAFNLLHADIVRAKLRPGEKMHVERIRKAYGVGATPLRKALSRLSSLDLVTAEGQRGFRVAPVSVANLLDITKRARGSRASRCGRRSRRGTGDGTRTFWARPTGCVAVLKATGRA